MEPKFVQPFDTDLVEKALAIAQEAHEGVVDKSGQPYIMHPMHLALQMETQEEVITALLHDVVEDSDVTLVDLQNEGFPSAVLEAVDLLTHDKENVAYMDYIAALKPNDLARKVKMADLTHNMDQSRLPEPFSARDKARQTRYQRAYRELSAYDRAATLNK